MIGLKNFGPKATGIIGTVFRESKKTLGWEVRMMLFDGGVMAWRI